MTIAPGVRIKADRLAGLYVKGKLTANGTQAAPITFSSVKDDSVCGIGAANEPVCDTNNDGTGSVPAPNDWGWIEFGSGSDATSTIRRAVVRYGGYDYFNSAAIQLTGVSPTLENITFTQNYRNAVELVSGNWLTNNWSMTTVVYWMKDDVTVPAANAMTIAPGVRIKADRLAGLYVKGKLTANGTQAAPITFSSVKDDSVCGIGAANEPVCDTNNDGTGSVPAPNDWGWIEFGSGSDATSIIRRAVVRYGGYDYFNSAAIRLTGVSPTLENITLTQNYRNAVELVSGNWLTNNWNMTTVVYWMKDDVTVPAANTMTIAPGVKLKADRLAGLYINGKLTANGTEAAPITFSSVKDDSVCGIGAANEPICDTNSDGTGTSPAPSDWGWIEFGSGSDATSTIRRAIVRYGGYDYFNGAAIRLDAVSPTLSYIRFQTNRNGLELLSGARPTLECNDFENNLNYGIYNHQTSTVAMAENQWWGTPTGPRHASNPGGTGDQVTDGIDFTPWRVTSCTYPSSATNTPTPTSTPTPTTPPGQLWTWEREAELGYITNPAHLAVQTTPEASACEYVRTIVGWESGALEFTFITPTNGNYWLWARAKGISLGGNSFWVSVDNQPEFHYAIPQNGDVWTWGWSIVHNEDLPEGPGYLSAGNHTLRFRSREINSQLDKVLVCCVLNSHVKARELTFASRINRQR